ncbi:hypothetical protein J2S13_000284 [Oikeobacillus pervagus]|uniref:DUF4190 domain-containing protein n=1 Tax=Oikeobacillus pervagus TaxID=1325931 RepID=A0AAJ1T2X6_9BACI|nr:DUF4190 domain-containing protein [Oikeobacillus pervagus]MDQ0213890.1 hypothetical protein [Oikeobacillus pervagus]
MDEKNDRNKVNLEKEREEIPSIYDEETAAEIASPVSVNRESFRDQVDAETGGKIAGWAALILSIISLFAAPILFGAAGIVLGFVARRRGAETLGAWGIGIGVVSIVLGLFVYPFF